MCLATAIRPSRSLRYIVYSRMFALGCAVHLTLPDTHQAEWLLPDLALALGAIFLAASGCAAGWALCAVGLAVPLLFLSDQLTQSLQRVSQKAYQQTGPIDYGTGDGQAPGGQPGGEGEGAAEDEAVEGEYKEV